MSLFHILRACVVCAALCVAGHAAASHPDVEAAKTAYRNADFTATLTLLDVAELSPAATDDDRVAIHWYRAASYHAQGRSDDAAAALDRLLELRPLYQPDRTETPPNLRALFRSRQDLYQDQHGVWFTEPVLREDELSVGFKGHPEDVALARVFARAPGQANYVAFELQVVDGTARGALSDAALWEDAGAQGSMELVVEAYNAKGALLARHGDAVTPEHLPVEPRVAAAIAARLKPPDVAIPAPVAAPEAAPRRRGFTPWMAMATLSAGAFGCCSVSCLTGAALFVTGLISAIASEGRNQDGGLAPILFPSSGLCCSLSCLSLVSTLLLGTCTGTLWGAEVYYLGQLPFLPSSAPEQSTEEDTLEPIEPE